MRTRTLPEPDPKPRIDIPPAAPADTPYPVTPLEVTNKPGTSSSMEGRREFSSETAILCLPTTEIGAGRISLSRAVRVPVTTAVDMVSRFSCALLSGDENKTAGKRTAVSKASLFFIVLCSFAVIAK